jgi:hypothetical protein
LDLVGNQECTRVVASRADCLRVTRGWHQHAILALHGFDQHGRRPERHRGA